MMTDHFKKL